MRDLQNLRQRIAQADRHFRAAEEARTRESDTLSETWESLKQRFDTQQTELARYRARLEVLVEANDELAAMIDLLIGTIEASAKRAQDETVPRITRLAQDLLTAEPNPAEMERLKVRSIEADAVAATPQPTEPDSPVIAARSDSPNVGAIIERIEGMVERGAAPLNGESPGAHDPEPQADDPLARELRDIQTLRNELTGLRDRITADVGR